MRHRLTSLALVLALLGTFAFGATRTQAAPNIGGAAGLVAAVVQLNEVLVNNGEIEVEVIELDDVLNNSLNNLRALNNILNNSPILSGNDINISDITIEDIEVLTGIDVNVDVDDIVVAVLSNAAGDFIVLTR